MERKFTAQTEGTGENPVKTSSDQLAYLFAQNYKGLLEECNLATDQTLTGSKLQKCHSLYYKNVTSPAIKNKDFGGLPHNSHALDTRACCNLATETIRFNEQNLSDESTSEKMSAQTMQDLNYF